jgi:acetyl esterase/lipase
MTIPPIEKKVRLGLPFTRFMQNFIPLPLSNWLIEQGNARVRLDDGVAREAVIADGVPCEWIIPQKARQDIVLLYLHGGGFVFKLTPPHLQMGGYLAQQMGIRILMVDYRTAPENPFPAPLEDCTTAYHWLTDQGILPQNIVVAGDSAGGNLTITLLMRLRDECHPLPAAGACLSPVTDLSPDANRRKDFKDPLLSPKARAFYTRSYLGSNDPYNPLISPVFGNFEGLPPLLIHAGEDEILREDAIRIAELAESAGVKVRLEIYPRMWHVWQLFLSLPQATQSLDDIAHFFKSHLAKPV